MHDMAPGAGAAMSSADSRELLHFPPMMQAHMLGNMRAHVETLDAILSAVAAGEYAKASSIAKTRLGLDSPAAEACKPQGANDKSAEPDSMDAMMALYMPAAMRALGLSMHTAASDFADVAERAETTHDDAAVLKALSRITPNCVACHSAYRLR
jgi:hypothetical protein